MNAPLSTPLLVLLTTRLLKGTNLTHACISICQYFTSSVALQCNLFVLGIVLKYFVLVVEGMLVINEVSNATECEFNTSKIWCRFDVERLLEIYHCCSPVTCDSWFMCASGCHVEFFTNTSANVIKYCILSRIHRFDPAIVLLHTTSRCNTCVERMIEVFCQKYEHLKTTVPKTDPASTLTDRCVSQYD